MKRHISTAFFILTAFLCSGICNVRAAAKDNKKQTFHITVLSTSGDPQAGMILKVTGYSAEHISDEQGLIEFEQEINPKNIRTANFYFPDNKQKSVKSLRLDEAATDTIIRIDSKEDMIRYKQSGKTFLIKGIVTSGNKPIEHAEVAIQGTGKRTFTNQDGEFAIETDYSHAVMVRAERMENKYLSASIFLENPDKPYTIRMTRKGSDRIYSNAEQMPEYPGGMKAFFNYVNRKARTAELAEKTQTEGAVVVQFIVEKDGSITSPRIVRGLHAVLDTAALDAIIAMRDWIPAKDHGAVVRCKYSVPVPFKRPKPKEPEKLPENTAIPKDSLRTDSLAADTAASDSVKMFAPAFAKDSLRTDSLRKILPLRTDSLRLDSLAVRQTDTQQTDSLVQSEQQPAAEVKPKKRNAFVRFFRWLFGIKDKEEEAEAAVPKEKKEETPALPNTETPQ